MLFELKNTHFLRKIRPKKSFGHSNIINRWYSKLPPIWNYLTDETFGRFGYLSFYKNQPTYLENKYYAFTNILTMRSNDAKFGLTEICI